MTIEVLHNEMVKAMKNRDAFRKEVISGIIARVKKTAIDKGSRDNITEEMVNQELLKSKKMAQEQIDTCPANRTVMLDNYKAEMDIIMEFCPSLITNETEIANIILESGFFISGDRSCQGKVMKYLKDNYAGKIDMKVAANAFKNMI